jgi:hypothetical protein
MLRPGLAGSQKQKRRPEIRAAFFMATPGKLAGLFRLLENFRISNSKRLAAHFVPRCRQTVENVHELHSTSLYPTPRISAVSSSARRNRDTDLGRYS